MRENENTPNSGSYNTFEEVLAFYNAKRKECPKGVTLKLDRQKYLLLQFKVPETGW